MCPSPASPQEVKRTFAGSSWVPPLPALLPAHPERLPTFGLHHPKGLYFTTFPEHTVQCSRLLDSEGASHRTHASV